VKRVFRLRVVAKDADSEAEEMRRVRLVR